MYIPYTRSLLLKRICHNSVQLQRKDCALVNKTEFNKKRCLSNGPGPTTEFLFHVEDQLNHSTVTFENVLNEENRQRVKEILRPGKPLSIYPSPRLAQIGQIKKAGVLVPLCTVNGEPSILFTLRSSKIPSHKGEVSFPGGNMDASDSDLIDTALRETEEELGFDRKQVEILGIMQPAIPSRHKDGAIVNGVLGYLGEVGDVSRLNICTDEVDYAFSRTIRTLCDPQYYGYTIFNQKNLNTKYILPVFFGENSPRIWGLSAVILHMSLLVLLDGLYKPKF